ncbi:MAG: FtsW/RodA/SpoVE family cell cycle protein [Candidatus Staskawiczbacteria bacterium]|nr:FtsW/RodA/SpoVE family cell cycle protein [Candidatus Staskawiczbacteria bacterium]
MGVLTGQLKKLDWGLIIPALALVCFGFVALYSTGLAKDNFGNLEKQIVFFVAGLLVMVGVSFFDYRILRNNSYLILVLYGICLALLLGLHFFAPIIKGTRGWYKIGFLSLDPIEPTKLVLVVLLAKYFSMRHVEMYKFRNIIFSGIYVLIPALLVFIKPDLGGTAVLLLIWLGILLVSGIKINHFLILSFCFLLVAGFAWGFLLKDYQKQRITAFIFPYDYFGASWSQNQTKISIGSGQLLGQGMGKGSQVQYGFLPEPHTDFIFSVIAQEWGAVGVLLLFVTYGFLVWRVLKVAIKSKSNFPRLFASGFAIILTAQFFINIGMNLSLLPVVGIYLPFISYGGSGLIGNFVCLGILQSIKTRG